LSYDVGMPPPPGRPREPEDPPAPRKDRVVQARVPRELEATLKAEARRRRLSVSQLVRHVLEDTFHLVDGLVADVDRLVGDSVDLARNAQARARRIGRPRRAASTPAGPPAERELPAEARVPDREVPGPLDDVVAWNEVVLHRRVHCAACGAAMARGSRGHLGLDEGGTPAGAWLCPRCLEQL
jgi:hypothetical protein